MRYMCQYCNKIFRTETGASLHELNCVPQTARQMREQEIERTRKRLKQLVKYYKQDYGITEQQEKAYKEYYAEVDNMMNFFE